MKSIYRFGLAVVLALTVLTFYNRQRIDAENLALGDQNQAAFEVWQEQRITAGRGPEILELVQGLAKSKGKIPGGRSGFLLWLGNSQLHAINQFKRGDHLAPYWLAEQEPCNRCPLPLGLSLPNANLQEHLVLTRLAIQQLPISQAFLKLVFDDLREDGLRDELDVVLTPEVRRLLATSSSGAETLRSFDGRPKGGAGSDRGGGLHGFAQEYIEDLLVDGVGRIVPLWAGRANLRSHLMIDIYNWRNWLFGIKPTSVRRMIKPRYDRNMSAFQDLVRGLQEMRIPLTVYIAPIRSDVPLPYDVKAYRAWIADIEMMSRTYGYKFLNLERLVPDGLWGTYLGDDIDFMHFQGPGHKLLADRLWSETRLLSAPIETPSLDLQSGGAKP